MLIKLVLQRTILNSRSHTKKVSLIILKIYFTSNNGVLGTLYFLQRWRKRNDISCLAFKTRIISDPNGPIHFVVKGTINPTL